MNASSTQTTRYVFKNLLAVPKTTTTKNDTVHRNGFKVKCDTKHHKLNKFASNLLQSVRAAGPFSNNGLARMLSMHTDTMVRQIKTTFILSILFHELIKIFLLDS